MGGNNKPPKPGTAAQKHLKKKKELSPTVQRETNVIPEKRDCGTRSEKVPP